MNDLPVKFHSKIAYALGNKCKLYYLMRAMDKAGSGRVVFNIDEVLLVLGCSYNTLINYLTSVSPQICRFYQRKNNQMIVYYQSLVNLGRAMKLENLGAVTELLASDLKEWRKYSILAEALKLQTQSYYVAKKEKTTGQQCLDLEGIFKIASRNTTSRNAHGVLVEELKLYYDSDKYARCGGSQSTIASRIGLTTRTVRRHLKNVAKIRSYYTHANIEHEYNAERMNDSLDHTNNSDLFFQATKSGFPPKTFFKAYTSLYLPILHSYNTKFLEYRLRGRKDTCSKKSLHPY
jgi:hypothetical protein